MISPRKLNPRAEYRLGRAEKIEQSATLAEKFPGLKSLRVHVEFFDSTGVTRTGEMKYKINLAHGKSLFCFNCVHGDCVGGDYDLTDELGRAISRKLKIVKGEIRCLGIRQNKERKTNTPCQALLRYKLTLSY